MRVNATGQADTPHLTLVSSSGQPPRKPTEEIEPIQFLRAITASLELDQVLHKLSEFLHDLVGHSGWEYRHPEQACELTGGHPDRHRLDYALALNGQQIGALTLMRGRRFSDIEQTRIEGLLGLAAPTLHNALRFYTVSQQLERDPLTGLGNRRALTLQGEQWLADAIRHQQPLSMLVMDLDRFKGVNDTYGHPLGDHLLCGLADSLRAVTRTADLCVRIGGDEFVVLLPGTDLFAAMECGERIRCAVARLSLTAPDGTPVSTSVSIGVATHRSGMDLDQLYRHADEALYAAKRAGCNRVVAGTGHAERERNGGAIPSL